MNKQAMSVHAPEKMSYVVLFVRKNRVPQSSVAIHFRRLKTDRCLAMCSIHIPNIFFFRPDKDGGKGLSRSFVGYQSSYDGGKSRGRDHARKKNGTIVLSTKKARKYPLFGTSHHTIGSLLFSPFFRKRGEKRVFVQTQQRRGVPM